MNEPLKQLQATLAREVPNAFLLLVDNGWDEGFLHVYQGGALVIVEHRAKHGFGVTLLQEDDTGFELPDEVYPDVAPTVEGVSKLLAAHGAPGYDTPLTDGLRAARDAIGEVVGMLVSHRAAAETRDRLRAVADDLGNVPTKSRSDFTGDPDGVVAHLERVEQRLRVEARRLPIQVDGVGQKLEATADRLLHLANMTASADKARWMSGERHRFPA